MKVMSLNLNSYQEENQSEKFEKIAGTIVEKGIDVAVFCEASQRISTETFNNYVRVDNAIKLICDLVNQQSDDRYEFAWDFSHYGFKIYEEGIGILTKLPIKEVVTKYVSKTHDIFTFKSRKIMRTIIDYYGEDIAFYSVQLGWLDDGYEPFLNQFENLNNWVQELDCVSILAGDFGNDVMTKAYQKIIDANYIDQYVLHKNDGMHDETFINPVCWDDYQDYKPLRLDYIFTNSLKYKAIDAQLLFPKEERVSDHKAVYIELKKVEE